MANFDELTSTGLQTKDNNTLLSDIQNSIQNIYGQNAEPINFSSASPDGNFTEIVAEMGTVVRELLTEVYNSCSPSKVSGTVQDDRYQINYLTRKGGTFTIQNIDITANKTVTLQGLDGSYNDLNATAYAVSDEAGQIWYLIDTTTIFAGTTSLPFRAKEQGQVIPTVGTITNQVTIVGGILEVNNNVGYTSLGVEQETDYDFRIRREQSPALASENNDDAIISKLWQLDGVTSVKVWDNRTNATDETGTEAHTVWAIVNGGANADIADVIYSNIGGSDTRGDIVINLANISGQQVPIRFDRPTVRPLYIKFDIQALTDNLIVDEDGIKQAIVENLNYSIDEDAETSKVTGACAYALELSGTKGYAVNVLISGDEPTATIDFEASTGITNASVDAVEFYAEEETAGIYEFMYENSTGTYNGGAVELAGFGITVEGTPQENDTITVDLTPPTYTNFVPCETIADLFTVDTSRISIGVIE
jgi:hypothetical protein